ncbi:hypothetical protein BDP27DRAFT_1367259 [Rhodocollybia butyracea]|uniref:BING4 C-terminal domain-containing protein n=1 Tax=Rhodocollybia butyracea TaxID=206335 RepID=A0A9P5PET3_9AGAR|nr:hypothetical protein BDP27DRAFT_1367259 [Rhodocollybia butyracea]
MERTAYGSCRKTGHVAAFNTLTGAIHNELQLGETGKDILFLQDHSFYRHTAKIHFYLRSTRRIVIHKLKDHISSTRLKFLPYHWPRTALGACSALSPAQNPHYAVLYLEHQNGCVTPWTPNLPHSAVKVLVHLGPVASVYVDPSGGGGTWPPLEKMAALRYGIVGTGKAPYVNGASGTAEKETQKWSGVRKAQKGVLAVASGGSVNMELVVSLVPGAGEGGMDTGDLDLYEGVKGHRERKVRALLDEPDLITLDPEFVGGLAPSSKLTTKISTTDRQGGTREEEDARKGRECEEVLEEAKEKCYPTAVTIRAKLEKLQAERKAEIRRVRYGDEPQEKSSALDQFKRTLKT